ncbi:phosphotransferase family protein, partial [Actinomadura adrarensis]
GPLRPTWREAFLEMVDAVLDDAERFEVPLPRPADHIRGVLAAQGPVLDEVRVPRLVHFDLWDGNILVDLGPDGRRIGALIDAERAFWGDPMAEFVSLALFDDIASDEALLAGYRSAGGSVVFDTAARRRLDLYRAYLYLIMWVEAVPRKFDTQRCAWLREQVVEPLAMMLNDWSEV